MPFDIANLKIDSRAAQSGVWFDYATGQRVSDKGPFNSERLYLRLARMNNPKFTEAYTKLLTSGARRARRISGENTDENMKQAVAEAVLIDWKNMLEDGKPIRYSTQTAIRLFNEAPDFFQDVISIAAQLEGYRQVSTEEISGNSPKS